MIERLQAVNTWGSAGGTGTSAAWDVPVIGELLRLVARMAAGAVGVVGGLYQYLVHDAVLPPFDWWRPSRVHFGYFDITEFPYFSFLFADLHAHLMGLPFFGFVIACGIAYVLSAVRQLRWQALTLAAALGLALALVRMVHTWDFYTAVLLAVVAVVAGQAMAPGRWQERWWRGVGHAALAAAVLLIPFSPYTSRFEVYESGVVLARQTTELQQYLAHFGLFVAVMLGFMAVRYCEELARRLGNPGYNPFLGLLSGRMELLSLALFLAGVSLFAWQWGLTTVALSVITLAFLANLLWLEWRAPVRNIPRIIATAMFGAAVGIAGGVDIVQAEYDIVRMNTVFKFSLQAWQLYALASGYGAWYVGRYLWDWQGWAVRLRPRRDWAAATAVLVFGVLLVSAAVYPFSGTRARQEARFEGSPTGTLDGLAYLPYGSFAEDRATTTDPADDRLIALGDDEPLIRWLRENVEGSPVIVEAVGPLYHWAGRMSWNTGLPAVIGWDWHEVAYRTAYDFQVQQRRADTARFYADPSAAWAAEYLDRYNVSYVIVGTEEHVFGTREGLEKFEHMVELEAVYRSGPYVIYEVRNP
jgi:YYY domain-containing protein